MIKVFALVRWKHFSSYYGNYFKNHLQLLIGVVGDIPVS